MQLVSNRYQVGGLDVLEICQEFGTPLYLYDGDTILSRIKRLQTAFADLPVQFKYAAKALTNVSILRLMHRQGLGLDVVSLPEAELGLRAGFAPSEIIFTPNGVSFAEIQAGVERGLVINLDNLPILEQFGAAYGSTVPCCIRLNPHVLAGGNAKIQVGHSQSKFGISVQQLPQVQQLVQRYGLRVAGLHVHTGSEIAEVTAFLAGVAVVFEAAHQFPNLEFIDLGSGFKSPYRPGDAATNLEELGQRLAGAYHQFCQAYGSQPQIWFEPGKYLVGDAGVLLVRTNVVKPTPALVFVGVDSGMNHLIRPALYDAYHEMVNVSNPGAPLQEYSVVGYICETDTLGEARQLAQVREGDIIGIKNTGAYGYSMSSNYNSRFRPAEALVHERKAHLIRHHETLDDLLRHQVLMEF